MSSYKLLFAGLGAQFDYSHRDLSSILKQDADFYLDNDPSRRNSIIFGKMVLATDQLDLNQRYEIYIFSRNFEDICLKLKNFKVNCNCYYVNIEKKQFAISAIPRVYTSDAEVCKNILLEVGNYHLNGKRALVTGASRGVGNKISIELAKLGCDLILLGRENNILELVANDCRSLGVNVDTFSVDLADHINLKNLLTNIGSENVDIIYNNAAVSMAKNNIYEINVEAYIKTLAVNLIAPTIISLFFFEKMLMNKKGVIINISTNIHKNLFSIEYATSKAGLDKLTQELAIKSIGCDELSVLSIDPGAVRTDMSLWQGSHDVDALTPGLLIGLFAPKVNGKNLVAKDYFGLSLSKAIEKYKKVYLQ